MEKSEKVTEVTTDIEDEETSLVITLKTPYKFEGKSYSEIDLTPLENITASDMIAVNKRMSKGGIDIMPEVTLEYACEIAARACEMPIEFYLNLPPKAAMKVKNRVVGFFFNEE